MAARKCPDCGKTLRTVPRFATKPTKGAKTWQAPVIRSAERLGTPFMPWQRSSTRIITELRPDGLPRFKTVIVSVPRQQGKTTLSRSALTARAERADDLKLYSTAQTRVYAAKHVLALGDALGGAVSVRRGIGAERVTWPNGSTLEPISPTEGGGHGDSIDFMLADEGWTLSSATMGGIRPAMIARPHSQLLIISTMGTVESSVWNGLVARGREATEDPDATMAYLEYSAPSDDAVFDESRWHQWMPALGITVSHADIRAAMADMEPAEIIRAFGNRTTQALVSIFPGEWVERAWRVIEPPQKFALAVDVNDEPPGASVVTGHVTDEGVATRLVEWRFGSPRWIPKLVHEIVQSREVEVIVADFGGPAKQIEADLRSIGESTYTPVEDCKPRELGADTQRFYDDLREGRAQMMRVEELELAMGGARRKQLGDLWLVSRRQMSVDASPLIATIAAHGMASELAVQPVVGWSIW